MLQVARSVPHIVAPRNRERCMGVPMRYNATWQGIVVAVDELNLRGESRCRCGLIAIQMWAGPTADADVA